MRNFKPELISMTTHFRNFLALPNPCGSKENNLTISGEKIGRFQGVPLLRSSQINKGMESRPFHANHIKFPPIERKYIAAQTPIDENHAGEFLKALRHEKCEHLVWLVPPDEVKAKGLDVYPLEIGQKILGYTCTDVYKVPKSCEICIKLISDDMEHHLIIHQFVGWLDMQAPNIDHLLQFRESVEECMKKVKGPLAVSCRAGIGRTGTYIAIDAALQGNKKPSDIKELVTSLRQQRFGAIETFEQYMFIFNFLYST